MKTISIVNNKGGVAKTSSAVNIGAYLAYKGYKVLLVDTDSQSNLTQHLNFYDVKKSLYNAYQDYKDLGGKTKAPIIQHEENTNLYILPASKRLRETERELVTYNANQNVLSKILKPLQEYFDFCFIDCPPALGLLTDNAIVASDSVIIPIEASQFSLNGVEAIIGYLDDLKLHNDLTFDIAGVFMSKFDVRESISEVVKTEIQKYFHKLMFNTSIRINTDIKKAQANGKDIFVFAGDSNSAIDYSNLADEIIQRTNQIKEPA